MHRAAMTPQRGADRTRAGASGALVLPQFLASARTQLAVLRGMGAGAQRGAVMFYRLPQQVFVDAAENFFRQLQRANFFAAQVDHINLCHKKSLADTASYHLLFLSSRGLFSSLQRIYRGGAGKAAPLARRLLGFVD